MNIRDKIYEFRGRRVMLDRDLAELYGIETKVLNQAVKRNISRFEGEDFMFELTKDESLRCQNAILEMKLVEDERSRSQIATLNRGRGSNIKYLPHAFTELGVAMLSSVLRSDTAIDVNRNIMRTFVTMRQMVMNSIELSEIRERLMRLERADEDNLEAINDLSEYAREEIDNLYLAIGELSVKPAPKEREPIGYKYGKD